MITLTTPPSVNSVLGGSAPVSYNKLVLSPFTMNPVTQVVTGTLRLTSTASPNMPPMNGTLTINLAVSPALLTVEVPQLDFYRQVQLTAGQVTSVQTIITNAQNGLEAGLVSLGVISGTQAAGA